MTEIETNETDFEPSKKNWRSFWSLLIMQTQNSFNDKAVQYLLVCAAAAFVTAGVETGLTQNMPHVLAALVVTPFILLSPLAGWVGDRFAKSTIIRFSALFQVVIFLLLLLAMMGKNIELLVTSFLLLAIQSAILSPAKIGVIKELVGKRKLGYASGMLEMFTILGILFGTIIMSRWYGARLGSGMDAWEAFKFPMYVLLCCTPIAILGAFNVEKTKAKATRPFKASILVEHFGQVWSLLQRRKLRLSSLAVTYFWVFGGFIQLLSVQIAQEKTGVSGIGPDLANMMLAAGCGIALGSVVASMVSKRRIELGLVPVGGILMVITCVLMAVTEPLGFWFMTWMFVSGMGAAFFLVPVNACLQDSSEESERGNIIAANNLLNCLGGILIVGFQLLLQKTGVPIAAQFLILAGTTLLATAYATRLLPREFFRFTMLMLIRVVYRIRIEQDGKMPKEGGVLLVPNHVSYLDAFIISAASPRPVRFLMFDEYFKKSWMVWFLKLFNTVPISRKKAKEAITVAAEAVAAGDVVCIFPEGQLTRTGALSELKRGFEMIARKANCPVQPVYMDGLWGSIFSFERGKYIYKWPYRLQYGVTVTFGETLEPRQATHIEVRKRLLELGAESMSMRDSVMRAEQFVNKHAQVLEGDSAIAELACKDFAKLDSTQQKLRALNALQLADGPALLRGETIAVEVESSKNVASVLLHTLPLSNKHRLILVDKNTSVRDLKQWKDQYNVEAWIGSEALWEKCDAAGFANIKRFDLTGKQDEGCFPWWVENGLVVGVSMPDPNAETATNQHQPGSKIGHIGRLLPGFYTDEKEEQLTIHTAIDSSSITTCAVSSIDSEGFCKATAVVQ